MNKYFMTSILLCLSFSVMAIEPPTDINQIPITYRVQVANYFAYQSAPTPEEKEKVWQNIVPVEILFFDGPLLPAVQYGAFGDRWIEAETLDSTPENPRRVEIKINMPQPSGVLFAFNVFIVRIKVVTEIDGKIIVGGIWSEPSDWICLIYLGMMNQPIWR